MGLLCRVVETYRSSVDVVWINLGQTRTRETVTTCEFPVDVLPHVGYDVAPHVHLAAALHWR